MDKKYSYRIRAHYPGRIVFSLHWQGNRAVFIEVYAIPVDGKKYRLATEEGGHYESWMGYPIRDMIRTAEMRFKEIAGQTVLQF